MRKRQQAEQVTKEELMFALNLGGAAADGKMASTNPNTRGVMDEESGKVYTLADTPFARGVVAIADHFKHRPALYRVSLTWRLTMIGDIAKDPAFAEWFKSEEISRKQLADDKL